MRFTMIVNHANAKKNEKAWREPLNRPQIRSEKAAREEAEGIVKNFNDTLRAGERPRVLIDVEFGDKIAADFAD